MPQQPGRRRRRRGRRGRGGAQRAEAAARQDAAQDKPELNVEPEDQRREDRPGARVRPKRPDTVFGMPRMLFAITLGLVVAVGGIFILNLVTDPVEDLDIADAIRHADQGRRHLEPGESFGDYNSFPPTSGPQSASAPEPGVYGADQPAPFNEVPEPSEFLPLLEQGGVVVYFDPSAASERDRETLQELAFSLLERGHVIAIAPVEGLVDRTAAVVATAWRHTLPLDQLTAEAQQALGLFLTDLTAGGFQGRFVLDAAGRRESQAAVDARASETAEATEGDEG